MTYIFIAIFAFALLGLVLWIFVNSNPKTLASMFKLAIPVSLFVFGIIATIAGQGQFGIPAFIIAIFWWYIYLRGK